MAYRSQPVSAPTRTLASRFLSAPGFDDTAVAYGKAMALRRFILIHVTVEIWLDRAAGAHGGLADYWGLPGVDLPHRPYLFVTVMSLCCVFGWFPRYSRHATITFFATFLFLGILRFPDIPNHSYLELAVLALAALLDPRKSDENQLLLQGCRWTVLIVLFSAGLQKLLYGSYFDGRALATALASSQAKFAVFFEFILPADEFSRIIDPVNQGPHRFHSTIGLLVSNASFLAELMIPVAILFARTRTVATYLGLGLVFAIQLGAREVFFGALMIHLLLLIFPSDVNRKFLIALLMLDAWMVAAGLHLVPRFGLT